MGTATRLVLGLLLTGVFSISNAQASIEAVEICTQEANIAQLEGAEFESYVALCMEHLAPASEVDDASAEAYDRSYDVPYESLHMGAEQEPYGSYENHSGADSESSE